MPSLSARTAAVPRLPSGWGEKTPRALGGKFRLTAGDGCAMVHSHPEAESIRPGTAGRTPLGWVAPLSICALLTGCVSSGIDRADRATEARIAQVERAFAAQASDLEAKSRAFVAEALANAQSRADDSVAKATADLATRVSLERQATLADVDARVDAKLDKLEQATARLLADLDARLDAQRKDTLNVLVQQRQAASDDLKALVEVSLPRAVGSAVDVAVGRFAPAPAPGSPTTPGQPRDTTELLITGGAAVVSTLLIRWLDHKRKGKA